MSSRYAAIYQDRTTDDHITLMQALGINCNRESLLPSRPDIDPPLYLIEWDHDKAAIVPEAVAAIQTMEDEGVTIMTDLEVVDYLADGDSPFYPLDIP